MEKSLTHKIPSGTKNVTQANDRFKRNSRLKQMYFRNHPSLHHTIIQHNNKEAQTINGKVTVEANLYAFASKQYDTKENKTLT